MVLVKLLPQQFKSLRPMHKGLVRRYEGHFPILGKVGKVSYRVELPLRLKIHPVFHVSYLKPYHGDKDDPSRGLSKRAPTAVVTSYDKEVEHIIADRIIRRRGVPPAMEYLVKWKGLPESEASWEPADALWQFQEQIERQSVPCPTPYVLHSQIDVTPPPVVAPIPALEDTHACMDILDQRMRQRRVSNGAISWDDFDGAPIASLLAQFRIPEIEKYTGIGCPKIHLRLYSSVMRAHGLDEAHLIMLFPMSLSGTTQRWRELEALRQGPDKSVTSFISRWREKIAQIVDRPSENDQIGMILRSLQPRFDRHLMGFPHTDFGSLVQALYGMPLSRAFQKLMEGGLLTRLAPRPVSQPMPPRFRMDLHCSYHQGLGHDMNHCPALRYAIHDLIDQGLVNLGQPSVTTNHLLAHSTHVVPPPLGGIHHIDFVEDDNIHMMSWDDGLLEPIVLNDGYEIDTVGFQTSTPFSLISDWVPYELTPIAALGIARQGPSVPFILRPDDDDSEGRDALSQIQVETTTTLEGLIHMMMADRATCIVFSDYDLPLEGSNHTRPLYITVGCSGHRVSSVLLDNGSVLNICPLTTTIALSYAPLEFSPSAQTVKAYDSTKRKVFKIPTSFNLLLGQPWIHRVGDIPSSSLHQNVKFIHDKQVITVQPPKDVFASSEPMLQISHSENDLFFTGFTFDEVQTLEVEDFCRDFVAMSFDQHSSMTVLDMMRGMSFMLGMGLGRRQHRPMEFVATIDHDAPFGFGFVPTEANYRYMARLSRERLEDETSGAPISVMIVPSSPNRANFLSLCFPEETIDCGVDVEPTRMIDGVFPHDDYRDEMDTTSMSQITERVQPKSASPFNLCRVSAIEIVEEIQTVLAPELMEDVAVGDDLFEDTFRSIEEASNIVDLPFSFDILSGFISHPGDVYDSASMDLSVFEYLLVSCDNSFDHDLDLIDERVSLATGDVETVDFGIEDQLKELKIGSPLSTDERDRLIHLLISYLDILMAIEDMEKTTFIIEWGTYCYRVMPFWLKNVGATYQRATTTLFHDMMHRNVEVYVDDMIVKSRGRADHLATLRRFFERIHKFRLRLNPKKCTFGVTFGKLLGHMLSERGIEVDPDKIKVILDMLVPRTEKEIRGFLGKLQYISCFIARLSNICVALGCMLAQLDDLGKKQAIYYLSKRMLEYEMRYTRLPRAQNQFADALATLASSVDFLTDVVIRPLLIESRFAPAYCCLIGDIEVQDDLRWHHNIYQLLRSGTYPEDAIAKDRRALRQLATRFVICGETLYR
uniref:Chromo domain-containing protein n=1 Tax=Vitis vinifera TaxID=29760 RepID=A5BEX6_VITVI|nr:hypothetical protein VITISV_020214 [Vitis vinifera]